MFVAPAPRRLETVMNRDPRFALSQELEAKQTLLDQLRALAADDPYFFNDLTEGETKLLELIAILEACLNTPTGNGSQSRASPGWHESALIKTV